MRVTDRIMAGLLTALIVLPAVAQAQAISDTVPPDPDAIRGRLGPLWVQPSLTLVNAGVDTNVFNEADPLNPDRDFTLTFVPAANLWLPFGSTWIRGSVREDLVWYREFASERSANTTTTVGWLVPLTRMTLAVDGRFARTKERPGFEIDERATRWERGVASSFELRALSRTLIGVRAERRTFSFDEGEAFLGIDLRHELNRRQTSEMVTVRHELTPLTTATLDVGMEQDRFDFEPLRDSDSTRVVAGLSFAPDALISGTARLGYRRFTPSSGLVPSYRGSTASVSLSYVAAAFTQLGIQVNRDVEFSFDESAPYYVQTGIGGTVTQQIFGPVDLQGRASVQRLAYQAREDAADALADRTDRVRSFGTGIGYRVGPDLRVGFNVDRVRRTSPLPDREYDGWRYGSTASYGF